MKITPKILHIPPHLSTSWIQVRAVYPKENGLTISLLNGDDIVIPELAQEIRDAIFNAYAAFLENQQQQQRAHPGVSQALPPFQMFHLSPNQLLKDPGQAMSDGTPMIRLAFDNMETMAASMQHNMAQSQTPDIPAEILQKIVEVVKMIAPDLNNNLSKPEPHCNCPHCQIARAVTNTPTQAQQPAAPAEVPEEVIADHELAFQQWDIIQTKDKLYSLTNRLDTTEQYTVYLGDPLGCTCGRNNCEHILAVLKS